MRAYVIAMESEAEVVRAAMRADDRLYVSGIGKANAAAATMQAICEGATEIVNVGLCGGFGAAVEVGGIYEVEAAVEYDFDLAQLNGTRVGQLNERTSPFIPLRTTGDFHARRLATGDHFNDSESDYQLITEELGCSLRDMEGAAIAHIAEKFSVPCRAIKAVTNIAGGGSMTGQYVENQERVLECLRSALISLR